MQFDKAAYKTAKERIISLIKSSHDWENTEGFIADGVICPDVYEKQPLRILCVLAESYGYEECKMVDIEEQPLKDRLGVGNPDVRTPRRLAVMLRLLFGSLESSSKIPREDMLELLGTDAESVALNQETLSKIAWINVKKASNPETRLDAEKAQQHAERNRNILQEQIAAISPHLILICGQAAFSALLEMGLLGPQIVSGRGWQIQDSGSGMRVIEISHPAYPEDWNSYDKIYRNFETIYSQMA